MTSTFIYRIRKSQSLLLTAWFAMVLLSQGQEAQAARRTFTPGAPTNLAATALSDSQVRLTWVSGGNTTRYSVERSLNGTDYTVVAAPSATTFTDSGLTALTLYYYRVKAHGRKGETSAYVHVMVTTLAKTNQPPLAAAGGPYTAIAGILVTLDGSGSADPDGTIASYLWDYGDGQSSQGTALPTTTHTYATAGTYTAKLTVTDNSGASASATAMVTVAPNSGLTAGQTAFQNSVYVITRRDCAGCHSLSQVLPNHASANVVTAYDAAKPRANFMTPSASIIVAKIMDGHCGSAVCTTNGAEMTAAVTLWAATENAQPSPTPSPSPSPGNSVTLSGILIPKTIPMGSIQFATLSFNLAGVGGLKDGVFKIDVSNFNGLNYLLVNPRIEGATTPIKARKITVILNGVEDTTITSYKDVNATVPAGASMGLLDEGARGPALPSIKTLGSDVLSLKFEGLGP